MTRCRNSRWPAGKSPTGIGTIRVVRQAPVAAERENNRRLPLVGARRNIQESIQLVGLTELIDQGRGFQKAFDAFATWCTARPDCGLGQDKNQAVSKFQALVRPLINKPIGVPDGRKLSYSDATIWTVQALYLSDLWPTLNRGLVELTQAQGTILMRLADGDEADAPFRPADEHPVEPVGARPGLCRRQPFLDHAAFQFAALCRPGQPRVPVQSVRRHQEIGRLRILRIGLGRFERAGALHHFGDGLHRHPQT